MGRTSRLATVVATCLAILAMGSSGCDLQKLGLASKKEKAAIKRVLNEDSETQPDAYEKERIQKKIPVPIIRDALYTAITVDRMKEIQVHDCPADFAEAYLDHRYAWEDKLKLFDRLPSNVLEAGLEAVVSDSALRTLVGQYNSMSSDFDRASDEISRTWREVEKTAARYGVPLP